MLGEPLKLKVTSRMNKHISRFAVHMAHAPMGPILIGPNLHPNLRIELRSEAMKIDFSISICANIINTIGIKFEMQELVRKT